MAFGFQPMQQPNLLGGLQQNLAAAMPSTQEATPPIPTAPTKPLMTTGDLKALYQRLSGGAPAAPAAAAPAATAAAPVAADAGAGAAADAGAGAASGASGGGSAISSIIAALFGG